MHPIFACSLYFCNLNYSGSLPFRGNHIGGEIVRDLNVTNANGSPVSSPGPYRKVLCGKQWPQGSEKSWISGIELPLLE